MRRSSATGCRRSQVSRASLLTTFDTNVAGISATTNALLPLLRASSRPRILNVSSELGSTRLVNDPDWPHSDVAAAAYQASKSAVDMLTVLYAKELAHESISVVSVSPGYRRTGLNNGEPMEGPVILPWGRPASSGLRCPLNSAPVSSSAIRGSSSPGESCQYRGMDGQAAGEFLRAVRESRDPSAFGFAPNGRRTSGLRRSEVAELAHISVEHYTNLERGRGSGPSEQVLGALADGMRLGADERRHLFQLAGRNVPTGSEPSTEVSPSVVKLVQGLGSTAALVLSARFDILAWNAAAAELMEDFGALAPAERNIARRHFLSEQGHYGMSEAQEFSRMVAGQLRATAARYPGTRARSS